MHLRRPLALTVGALVLTLGGLTSCGFDLATDQPYTPGEGTNNREGTVKVLSALIVAAQPNEATFVVTLANSDEAEPVSFTGLAASGGDELEVTEFDPIEVPPRGYVNLADEGGVLVSGDFDAGSFLNLTLTYDNGDTTTLDVPVVTACGPYEGLDVTEDSEFIPYACDVEPTPVGEITPAEGDAEESE